MSRQIKCDRCDQVVPEKNEAATRELALCEDGGNMKMLGDICPSCIASLRAWMKSPRATRGPRP